jgi:hypothetical protein
MATAPTLQFLSSTNGYIPEASGELIAFARDESQFKINKWLQYVPAPTPNFMFAQLGRDQMIRVVNTDLNSWIPGDDMPDGKGNKLPFAWQEGLVQDKVYPWILPYREIDMTKVFSPRLAYTRMAATQCLTDRTNRAAVLATKTANWGTHTAPANTLNGGAGPWSTGSDDPNSPQYLAILKTLQKAMRAINLDTNGVVKATMVQTVISPDAAIALSLAPEIVNFCRQSSVALRLQEDGFDPQYEMYGCPSMYRGFRLIVEDAPIVTANMIVPAAGDGFPNQPIMAAESARSYIWPAGTAVMTSVVGGLDGIYGSKSFSTIQLFHFGGLMQQKAFDEPIHERVKGRVQEATDIRLVANLSGYCVTGIL